MPVLAGPRQTRRARGPGSSRAEAAIEPSPPVKTGRRPAHAGGRGRRLSGSPLESFQNTQRALHAFVDRELRPTDLVALVRTGGSSGALQPFTTDRRVLHAAIDGLRWNVASRNGVEAFEPLNSWTTFAVGRQLDGDRPERFPGAHQLRTLDVGRRDARRAQSRRSGDTRLAGTKGHHLRLGGISTPGA